MQLRLVIILETTSFVACFNKNEESRECRIHKPQPTTGTKRKEKKRKTESNACKINKQMHGKYMSHVMRKPVYASAQPD